MFGMKGFHVSASGAIQGHHGPLVNHVIRDISIVQRETTLIIPDSIETVSLVESEIKWFPLVQQK